MSENSREQNPGPRRLSRRALIGGGIAIAGTALTVAPYWNQIRQFGVCQGSENRPLEWFYSAESVGVEWVNYDGNPDASNLKCAEKSIGGLVLLADNYDRLLERYSDQGTLQQAFAFSDNGKVRVGISELNSDTSFFGAAEGATAYLVGAEIQEGNLSATLGAYSQQSNRFYGAETTGLPAMSRSDFLRKNPHATMV